MENFKNHRNNKIHKGESVDNVFDKIVFWDTLAKTIGDPSLNSKVLEEYNQKQIFDAITVIETVISQVAKLSIEFLDSMVEQLDNVIEEVSLL